jgi:hypothetical protein
LAELVRKQGQLAAARPLHEEALRIRLLVFGEDHPHVAVSLNNLASLLFTQGSLEEAEPLYKRSLAIRKKVYGDNHPTVATVMKNLAVLLERLGQQKLQESQAQLRQVPSIMRHRSVSTSAASSMAVAPASVTSRYAAASAGANVGPMVAKRRGAPHPKQPSIKRARSCSADISASKVDSHLKARHQWSSNSNNNNTGGFRQDYFRRDLRESISGSSSGGSGWTVAAASSTISKHGPIRLLNLKEAKQPDPIPPKATTTTIATATPTPTVLSHVRVQSEKVPHTGVGSSPVNNTDMTTNLNAHTLLVQMAKDWQSASSAHQQAWHRFCSTRGGPDAHDPKSHDAGVLAKFLASSTNGSFDAGGDFGTRPLARAMESARSLAPKSPNPLPEAASRPVTATTPHQLVEDNLNGTSQGVLPDVVYDAECSPTKSRCSSGEAGDPPWMHLKIKKEAAANSNMGMIDLADDVENGNGEDGSIAVPAIGGIGGDIDDDFAASWVALQPPLQEQSSQYCTNLAALPAASRIPVQCPVSLKPMTDPVRNEACSHIYSREGILLLLNARLQCPCPIGGCRATVTVKSLRTDTEHLPTHSAYIDMEDDEEFDEDDDVEIQPILNRPRATSAPPTSNFRHIHQPVEMQLLLEQEEHARQKNANAHLPVEMQLLLEQADRRRNQ